MEMKIVHIALGTNLGNREHNLQQAIRLISEKIGTVSNCSPFYENEAQGFETDELFLNGCISVETALEPLPMLHILKEIEVSLGRVIKSNENYSSRPIDLDIILFGNQIINNIELEVPHPRFRDRLFVIKPLSDIDPDAIDPISLKTMNELLDLCQDISVLSFYELKARR
jgi:2-amino-4-hydroxy-6-hydroxymethyldihydropteridine diphosphokinase